jgi:tRNA nucleotidyltransferase (CCA-adding enzyme)
MTKITNILTMVLKDIVPEKKPDEVQDFIKKLNARLGKIKAKVVLGGSFAKGVWLKEDHDVDIFIVFDVSYKNKNLSDIVATILSPFAPERVHGSRDYFIITNKLKYEIVPVLKISTQGAANITDFSPLHVKWVQRKGKKYLNDIRLMKKFCKVQRVYGAESYINGFSGHVIDILVIHYKGFVNVLKASLKWKSKQTIDPEKYYARKNPWLIINTSKLGSPLLVVDPIMKERNAAAALRQDKLDKFQKAAKDFLKNPSLSFFEDKKVDITTLKKKHIVVEMTPLQGKEDVVGVKMLKAAQFITKKLEEFKVVSFDWVWEGKGIFWWQVKKKEISPVYLLQGPPEKMKEFAKNFRRKHGKIMIKKGKLYAEKKRKLCSVEKVIDSVCTHKYVMSRVKKCLRK